MSLKNKTEKNLVQYREQMLLRIQVDIRQLPITKLFLGPSQRGLSFKNNDWCLHKVKELEMDDHEDKDFLEDLNETDTFKLHSYTQQKNFTKGLVDLALLTANANQLIEAIQIEDELMKTLFIVLISLSIILQV